MTEAYAYDPIEGEDVQIDCTHNDTPHDFDVKRAVQGNDDPCGGTPEDARDNPRLVAADLDHDPVEACQGTITRIVEETCGLCGYDRANHTVHTLAGEHEVTCRRCGAKRRGGDWRPPTTDRDRVEDLRRHADTEGPVEEIGHLSPATSRFGGATEPIYAYNDGTGLYKWVQNGSVRSLRHDNLVQLVTEVLRDGRLDGDEVADLVDAATASGSLDPEAFDTFDRVGMMYSFKPDELIIDEWHVEGDEEGNDE